MSEKLLALDIGGVCLNIRPERCFGLLGYKSIAEVPKEVLSAIGDFERGKLDETQFLAEFRRAVESDLSDEFLRDAWNSILHSEIEGMIGVIREIREAGNRIVLLSDTSSMHIAEFRRRFEIAKELPDGVYSFVVGSCKPELAIYAAFEADHGRPDLYVDDRQFCIDGGMAYGWDTWQFTGVAEFRKALLDAGFLSQ